MAESWLTPRWPAPPGVRALSTLRSGGVSCAPYDSFNLAQHVGDAQAAVEANRERLCRAARLPATPCWLNQVHGTAVVDAARAPAGCAADGAFAREAGVVCAVMTADCLPLLLCERSGRWVAAVHAGWRGLAAGVIESAIACLTTPGEDILAWLGPAIGPGAFEVGEEVRAAFTGQDEDAARHFTPSPGGRWMMDLYGLARRRLAALGVRQVYGGEWCTVTEDARFFSYRRDGRTGRMASLIWLEREA
ncbi:MAG TPA: peptidoglycan editing factor PgeF [Gammaproteobacteria bacterium]|nr:peptidoglycan editing factor PgeF [Gammaproteobacteria bacterium]